MRRLLLVAAAVAALLLAFGARSAFAETQGSLSQLPPPNDCYQQEVVDQAPECGSGGTNGTGLSGTTDVVVSPDGANVYVLSATDNSIAEFTRNSDGSLSPLPSPNNCIAEVPNGNANSNSTCGNTVAQGLYSPQAITISPDGHNVYVVGQDASQQSDGTTTGGNGAIAVFDRNPDGSLTQRAADDCIAESQTGSTSTCAHQSGHGILAPSSVAVSPDGHNVYVADSRGAALAVFQRDSSGSLSQPDGSGDCLTDRSRESSGDCSSGAYGIGQANSVAVSPDGSNVYTAGTDISNSQAGVIAAFSRNGGDGSLSQPAGADDCIEGYIDSNEDCGKTGNGLAGLIGLAVSPDGNNVYSASQSPYTPPIAEFTRNGDGSLTQLSSPNDCIQETGSSGGCGSTGTGIGSGYRLVVSPDGASVYAAAPSNTQSPCFAANGCSDVAEFSRNPATGVLTQLPKPDDCVQDANVQSGTPECGTTGTGLGGPGIAISPDNANIYVTGNNDIAELARTPIQYSLSVTESGAGNGSVTDDQGGIVCPPTCQHSYNENTFVTLTANPAPGSTFAGWGGACSGTDTCTVYMSGDANVTATFSQNQPAAGPTYTLTVSKSGSGGGSVSDDQGGISCPPTCSHAYASGSKVTLTANPASGSAFDGWSGGGCSGTGTCTVTMNADTNVTATFSALPQGGGPGSPSIRSDAPHVQGSNGAGFSGVVNPEGSLTRVFWQYGLDKRYTKSGGGGPDYTNVTSQQTVGSGTSGQAVSTTVNGLLPNALYHMRLVAYNTDGTSFGPDLTFITPNGPAPSPPVIGKSFDLKPVSGIVYIVIGHKLIPITAVTQIPSGTIIDALRGTVEITSASGTKGKLYHGFFGGAVFQLTEAVLGADRGLTTLQLVEGTFKGAPTYATCTARSARAASPTAHAALSSRILQTLRSRSSGRFRTRGRYAAGTVRGTQWTTSDQCGGTLIAVQLHSVLVNDFVQQGLVLVPQGHSYLSGPNAPAPPESWEVTQPKHEHGEDGG